MAAPVVPGGGGGREEEGHNYVGHNYVGHNYMVQKYIGHNYIGHNYYLRTKTEVLGLKNRFFVWYAWILFFQNRFI